MKKLEAKESRVEIRGIKARCGPRPRDPCSPLMMPFYQGREVGELRNGKTARAIKVQIEGGTETGFECLASRKSKLSIGGTVEAFYEQIRKGPRGKKETRERSCESENGQMKAEGRAARPTMQIQVNQDHRRPSERWGVKKRGVRGENAETTEKPGE